MRRPHVYTRGPACGCVGCSVPCLVALAAVVTMGYLVWMAAVLL
ncbi:MAG TPA: hypothetical protein VNH38_03075 [Candidatus Dormibacteraeota bacterium]|nr:hypothetical protein [Candidatus Dormibacteraeota bacterium]